MNISDRVICKVGFETFTYKHTRVLARALNEYGRHISWFCLRIIRYPITLASVSYLQNVLLKLLISHPLYTCYIYRLWYFERLGASYKDQWAKQIRAYVSRCYRLKRDNLLPSHIKLDSTSSYISKSTSIYECHIFMRASAKTPRK